MASFLNRLKFAWDYFARGRHRVQPVPAPPDFDYPTPDPRLMEFLAGMYREHGATVRRVGNWISVDGGRVYIRAAHFDLRQNSQNLVLQVDFITLTDVGQHIVESFAGIGHDLTAAVQDACKSFQDASFHVLLVTLLGHPCEHVDREEWMIGGQPRQVTLGWLRMRGELPLDEWPRVFEGIHRQVEALSLPPGLHWVRYFYCHLPSDAPTIEALIDNDTQEQLEKQAAELPWPKPDTFYSVRLFFIIQDA